jgi:hypothetical protein
MVDFGSIDASVMNGIKAISLGEPMLKVSWTPLPDGGDWAKFTLEFRS